MNNVLGEALKQAINKSEFSNFVWKGEKVKEGDKYVQNTELIGDMSKDRLKQCYNHCLKMLNNDDVKNLGRLNVLKEVSEQINKCNVELFLRYCENTYQRNERNSVSRNSLRISLRQFIENTNEKLTEQGKKEIEDWSDIPISEAASQLPDEFKDISISDVMDGCIDYLG